MLSLRAARLQYARHSRRIEPDPLTGAVMTPIYATSTYVQKGPGVHRGFEYGRSQNPIRGAFERAVAVRRVALLASLSPLGLLPLVRFWTCLPIPQKPPGHSEMMSPRVDASLAGDLLALCGCRRQLFEAVLS